MKLLKSICLAFLFFSCSSVATADEEFIQPPDDVRSMIGKVITFNNGRHQKWHSTVTSVSKHSESMGEGVTLHIYPVTFQGLEVNRILFSFTGAGKKWEVDWGMTDDPLSGKMIPVQVEGFK